MEKTRHPVHLFIRPPVRLEIPVQSLRKPNDAAQSQSSTGRIRQAVIMHSIKKPWLWASVALVVLLSAMIWCTVDLVRWSWLVPGLQRRSDQSSIAMLLLTMACWLVFILAIFALRKALPRDGASPKARRLGTVVILLGSLLMGAAALSAAPSTSNDSARYAWDGIVQKAGISPYDRVPADPALSALRPSWLFQPETAKGDCDASIFPAIAERTAGECYAVNRPNVPTIYPPSAEIYFFLVRLALPAEVGFIGFQLAGLLVGLGVTAGLLRLSRRSTLPLDRVAWWAWSPLLIFEGINNAHVDLIGSALLLLAVVCLARGEVLSSGVAFGAAVAAKLIPVVAAPGMLYRKPWHFIATSLGTFALLYVPYVLLSGLAVLGYLPGYLNEEGYDSDKQTTRFALLTLIFPQKTAVVVGALILLALAIVIWRRTDPSRPWDGQALLISVILLVVSPNYVWYAFLLLPFILLSGRFEYSSWCWL
ncbi:conserved hypothetical protein [Renibacterium salmoninarum ATCC 33209]|uniref:DUF2029 domain-containing protein n=2 Tax=Renibacterium salmoninarum TaxID=1646 RepID=A9WPY3_RENSM|nr:conserved hypothetical protein [Renibacterium salmoninarum ATCC 33209]